LPQTKEISKEKENPVGTDPTYPKENGWREVIELCILNTTWPDSVDLG
jgi:hypothetical protein